MTPGRDLDGISDHAADTLPYRTRWLDSAAGHDEQFRVGSVDRTFRGIAFRLSRVGEPGSLIVRYGSTPGSGELGEARIPASAIHPVWDLWYGAEISLISLDPGRVYYVSLHAERGAAPRDGYLLYGPRQLGGVPASDAFDAAYRLIASGEGGPGRPEAEDTHEFGRRLLDPPAWRPLTPVPERAQPTANEVRITNDWSIGSASPDNPITDYAAEHVGSLLREAFGLELATGTPGPRIVLEVMAGDPTFPSDEAYELDVHAEGVIVRGSHPRGVLRGALSLGDALVQRRAPFVRTGRSHGHSRFERRITTPALPAGVRYSEISHELGYTDGLLARLAADGFNAVWVWVNLEEIAHASTVFPELDEPLAPIRLTRLQRLTEAAAHRGLDVYVYLASSYDHPVPDWFYRAYPETRGQGFFGNPMCTSDARVRAYHAEIVSNLGRFAPKVRGLIVNIDVEGYYFCGNDDTFRRRCPRCRRRPQVELAEEVLLNLRLAQKSAAPDQELIVWTYGSAHTWVESLLERLPSDIALQVDFSKGVEIERDGITHHTGDYNLTMIGPPPHFVRFHDEAVRSGRPFITKTEHAVSQEAIFVPYIPALDQWAARARQVASYPAAGWFANWDHYGYAESLPARLLAGMSEDPAPDFDVLLDRLACRFYGEEVLAEVRAAWRSFSDAIAAFPYSDHVARSPGPFQKGPSHPLWLDPAIPAVSHWRSWQNDLDWTAPWGPAVAGKYLREVRDGFDRGVAQLEAALHAVAPPYRDALEGEWRVARTIAASLATVLHLLDWIPLRDKFWASTDPGERTRLGRALRVIAINERANAAAVLPLLERNSRLGFASDGGGIIRGGLFTPALVRWKIGQLDDLLLRELPEAMATDRSVLA